MGTTINGVYTGAARERRRIALARLQNQLKSGKKPDKNGNPVDLLGSDITRIKKEIETLQSRI